MNKQEVLFSVDNQNIARITLSGTEKLNILTADVMQRLDAILSNIESNQTLQAVVIASDKPGVFIAGADIKMIEKLDNFDTALAEVTKGQEIYNRIANLKVPSVAVIDGVCLGGGLELALACTHRIASSNPKTQLGLPEVQLGVLPGFGGTQRLPRIIGLLQAIDMIASGKSIVASKAYKLGLVDSICSTNKLEAEVVKILQKYTPAKAAKSQTDNYKHPRKLYRIPLVTWFVCNIALKKVRQKTHGFYPAPLAAIKVIRKTYGCSITYGLKVEARAFSKLAIGEVSKNLIQLFFSKTNLQKQSSIDISHIHNTAVVGSGFMGGSIAWLLSKHNFDVRLKDIKWQFIAQAYATAASVYKKLIKRKKIRPHQANQKLHKISATLDYSGFNQQDLVIEAIPEDINLKINTFAELEAQVNEKTIIASNTSSLSINSMASGLTKPERFIGMHFFSPVPIMPLVEVIPGEKTSADVTNTVIKITSKLGKVPIVTKDCAGFLVNRVLLTYVNEAMYLLQDGVSIKNIDAAAVAFGMPVGPLALTDEVGWDVGLKVIKQLEESYGERMQVAGILKNMQLDIPDYLGRKSKKGFYVYNKKDKSINKELVRYIKQKTHSKHVANNSIIDRLLLIMINESALCIQEQVVENAATLDFAFIAGCGFPAFRGGILKYADSIGIQTIVQKLAALADKYGKRFAPTPLLKEMAKSGKQFYLDIPS